MVLACAGIVRAQPKLKQIAAAWVTLTVLLLVELDENRNYLKVTSLSL